MNERSIMLENEKIGTLLAKLSIPSIVGLLVSALYNVVDTIFVGKGVGTLAIGGLTIAFPIQMIMSAIALMVGAGAASAISRNLGAKEYEKADYYAGNAYLSIFVLSMMLVVSGLVFMNPILRFFGATETLLPYAREYMSIIFIGNLYYGFVLSSHHMIRSEGNARVSMNSMLIGAILNTILDPLFIFTFKMGIKGAAIATILSQFASFIYLISYFKSGKSSIKVKMHHLRPDLGILKEIFSIGSTTFARNASGSVVAIILNNSLRIYGGDLAISVFGIINRLTSLVFMPIIGVVHGMQPIAGYNFGAKKPERIKDSIVLSSKVTTIIGTIGLFLGFVFPKLIFRAFSNDSELIENGIDALRIVILMSPVIGIQTVGAGLYQAVGKATPAFFMTLLRQVILFIPLVLILPLFWGVYGIWVAFPLSDLVAFIITIIFLSMELKEIGTPKTA